MEKYSVGNLVAEFLELNGAATVFGIISVHNIPIMDGIAQRPGMRMVMTRGETGGSHMADGFARASGGLGVIVSSTGPGAANAVPGLVEARFAGTPLLHLTGQSPLAVLGKGMGAVHDVPDQLGMLKSVCKAAFRVESAQEALGVLRQAVLEARSAPCGPVSVEIPIDIQRTIIARPTSADAFAAIESVVRQPAADDVERLARALLGARRPLIWAGAGARHAGAEIRALLDEGLGMVTSWAGRGVVSDDHPQNLGALNGVGSPAVQDFYKTVDLMIVVGSRLRGHETLDQKAPLAANLAQIDIDPAADGRTYPNKLFVCGDCAVTLAALLARVRGRLAIEPGFASEVGRVKGEAAEAYRATLGPYASFPSALRAVVPADAVWVRDVTISSSTWGHRLFPVHSQKDNIYPVGAGIGQGLQLGIGAAIGAGARKVVVLTGDGGFFFNMTELWTAVQEKASVVVIVMNDRGYGVIRHMQDAMCEGRFRYGDLQGPDLLRLAELAGIPAWRVSAPGEFGPAVAQALAAEGPCLVEVDMTAIGAAPAYFPYSDLIEKARATRGA